MASSNKKSSERIEKATSDRKRGTLQSGRSGGGPNSRKATIATMRGERERHAVGQGPKRSREGAPSRGAGSRGSGRSATRRSSSGKGSASRQGATGNRARGTSSKKSKAS